MSATYQTVIYEKPGGSILRVLPNQYISSKRHLASLVGQKDWSDVAFMYFPHAIVITPGMHKVRSLSPNLPPSLVTKSGIPIEYAVTIKERENMLSKGVKCVVEFEGGMGDQLMEAAAVLTAKKKYPDSSFSIKAESRYIDIIRHIADIGEVESSYVGAKDKGFELRVSNHTNYLSDPRGGRFGKASLYGAWLGLEKVSKVAQVKVKKTDFEGNKAFFNEVLPAEKQGGFMIQFRSGSGHGKSWQSEKVIKLAGLLKAEYKKDVFVVGRANEVARGLPNIVDLTGRSTWWETCLLESKMDAVVCIDSGVMHLARSLKIPHITLWGGTNAQIILGEMEAELDIRLPLDCYDMVCYDCPKGTNACMTNISPEMVFKNVNLLLHNADSKQSAT